MTIDRRRVAPGQSVLVGVATVVATLLLLAVGAYGGMIVRRGGLIPNFETAPAVSNAPATTPVAAGERSAAAAVAACATAQKLARDAVNGTTGGTSLAASAEELRGFAVPGLTGWSKPAAGTAGLANAAGALDVLARTNAQPSDETTLALATLATGCRDVAKAAAPSNG